MKQKYLDIQQAVILRYGIKIEEHSTCRGRMHAHVKERKICKWHPKESYSATFSLLHEIGHIENNKSSMRRAEEEYYATIWAIDRLKEYGLPLKKQEIYSYQRYILLEMKRGERRGGNQYGDLNLYKYIGMDVSLEDFYNSLSVDWKLYIDGLI